VDESVVTGLVHLPFRPRSLPVKVLITTTINVPEVLRAWATGLEEEDHIIVAGDQKTPHSGVIDLLKDVTGEYGINTRYMAPEQQSQWTISDVLGWNTIQRRNIALLEAIKLRPSYIITVDDDNAPSTHDQVEQIIKMMESPGDIDIVQSSTGWYNPGEGCSPTVTHRGFPISQRHEVSDMTFDSRFTVDIAIGAMLWTGDPDIDAIERMVTKPFVKEVEYETIVPPGVWAPFNSQATVYRADVAPLMLMWPGVGRYDDIWASYLARRVMDQFKLSVYYGTPSVYQDRNEHDVMSDLSHELFGMQFTDEIVEALKQSDISYCKTMEHALNTVLGDLLNLDFLPRQTKLAFEAWSLDIATAGAWR
jgi:hypothetical protein